MAIIELQDVSKLYGFGDATTVALDEVNLTIQKGEFVAVMVFVVFFKYQKPPACVDQNSLCRYFFCGNVQYNFNFQITIKEKS